MPGTFNCPTTPLHCIETRKLSSSSYLCTGRGSSRRSYIAIQGSGVWIIKIRCSQYRAIIAISTLCYSHEKTVYLGTTSALSSCTEITQMKLRDQKFLAIEMC